MENVLQVDELNSEEPGVITAAELELVKREKLFFKRKYTNYSKQVSSKIVLYQNLLAIQKYNDKKRGRDVESDAVVSNLRHAIGALRSQ